MGLEPKIELQFDEHKTLIVYYWNVMASSVLGALKSYNISENRDMKFINEAEHVHSSSDQLEKQFKELSLRLGGD